MSENTTTETTENGAKTRNRKPIVLSHETIFVSFSRGENTTVGKVGFFTLDDEGNPTEMDVSLTWQELRKMTDALDEIAKTEKSGNIAERDAAAAAKRAARAAKLQADLVKLQAKLAELQGDVQANALASDESILADSDDDENDDDSPESADVYPTENDDEDESDDEDDDESDDE